MATLALPSDVAPGALEESARSFSCHLIETKRLVGTEFPWYPYVTLGNVAHFVTLLGEAGAARILSPRRALDIGAADGELAFFLESRGAQVDIVDHAATNHNGLAGVRRLTAALGSSVRLFDVDLDAQFALPDERYDIAFLLGILYHLKNPFFVLEALASRVASCVLSTRLARYASPTAPIADLSLAYLLDADECNGDATNFWIFSEAGLRRLLHRTGWDIAAMMTTGDTVASNPRDADHDERAFCYLRSRHYAPAP